MPTFVAKVRKDTGETQEQLVTVPTETQLGEYLARLDGFVLECAPYETPEVEPETVSRPVAPARTQRVRSRAQDLVLFTGHMQTLIDAGVPLVRALHVVQEQMENPAWSQVLARVIGSLEKGESFADSLGRFPRFFPPQFVHLIDVGEVSGNLPRVLGDLAEYGERQLETRSQLKSAIAYPALLITACTGVTIFLVAFVLPRVAGIFSTMKMDLPWITSALLACGTFIRGNLLWLLLTATAAVVGMLVLRATPRGRRLLHHLSLTLPAYGTLYRKFVMARFCRTMALLQRSGVSLLVSLELARRGLANAILEEFMVGVEKNLTEGAPLGEELQRSPHIPAMVSTMVSVGEETGALPEMFSKVARFYERDVDRTVKLLPKILEPAIIVLMTGLVGLIAASVFIPLSRIPQGVGAH